ncbi:MAG: hypothetical protein PVS2B2_04460 [Candidatus Acidiferrum sp.]
MPQQCGAKDRELRSPGLVTEFPASKEDALQALQEVLKDQIVHGTYMFDRDQTLNGAMVVASTPLFEPWKGEGQVFYKIRTQAIAPRHFLESADQGTIGVRYVLSMVTEERARIRIDAVFVEGAHRTMHASDGTVEAAETKAIQTHLQVIQNAEQEAAEALRQREGEELARQTVVHQREEESSGLAAAQSSAEDIEKRIAALRHQLERRVHAPGAKLKSAPFALATEIATLPAYTEVVVVIVTPHWYGVETPAGQRGWLPVSELELLP